MKIILITTIAIIVFIYASFSFINYGLTLSLVAEQAGQIKEKEQLRQLNEALNQTHLCSLEVVDCE